MSVIIVRKFIDKINEHDSAGLMALCTRDHVFIDSLGARHSDLAKLGPGWAGYFTLFPDYRVEVDTMIPADVRVLLSGWASGTHAPSGRSWRVTAAWRAVVQDSLIAEWQIYSDNKPVYEIFAKSV